MIGRISGFAVFATAIALSIRVSWKLFDADADDREFSVVSSSGP